MKPNTFIGMLPWNTLDAIMESHGLAHISTYCGPWMVAKSKNHLGWLKHVETQEGSLSLWSLDFVFHLFHLLSWRNCPDFSSSLRRRSWVSLQRLRRSFRIFAFFFRPFFEGQGQDMYKHRYCRGRRGFSQSRKTRARCFDGDLVFQDLGDPCGVHIGSMEPRDDGMLRGPWLGLFENRIPRTLKVYLIISYHDISSFSLLKIIQVN